jgi:hypothetical protein
MAQFNDDIFGNGFAESKDARGAMVCDYATFRTIYRLSSRASVRNKEQTVIATFKITPAYSDVTDDDLIEISNQVGASIENALRRDDVVAGFDTTQFLILLSNINLQSGKDVLHRLVLRIQDTVGDRVKIETNIKVVEAY